MPARFDPYIADKYHGKLREIQKIYFKFLADNWNKYDVFVYKGPVGAGKSVCAIATAKWRASLKDAAAVLTPRVMLQDQYTKEFTDVESLKGRSHYSCDDAGDCASHYNVCENYCSGCPYTQAKAKIVEDSVGVFNFLSYMFGSYTAHTLIIDEAHNAFEIVSEMYTKYIYRCVEDYGNINTIGEAMIYLEKKQTGLVMKLDQLRNSQGDEDEIIVLSKEIRHNKLMIAGVQKSPKDFFFEKRMLMYRGKETEALRLQPITLNNLSSLLFQGCSKIILMSGTINEMDIEKLGLQNKRIGYIEGPSPIPAANRPVVYKPVANMAYKHQQVAMPILATEILATADKEPGKGVIHTTYDVAAKLRPMLDGNPRFLFHDKNNKDAVYKRFRESDESLILVASGMAEGIDLPGDAGRWQVITKIHYPSLADGVMMYYKDKEKNYYSWLTVRTLVQQCGRISRGPDDYGKTYIFDTCFENLYKFNKKLFPSYFHEGLIFTHRKS